MHLVSNRAWDGNNSVLKVDIRRDPEILWRSVAARVLQLVVYNMRNQLFKHGRRLKAECSAREMLKGFCKVSKRTDGIF
jgi:hypothetical protein